MAALHGAVTPTLSPTLTLTNPDPNPNPKRNPKPNSDPDPNQVPYDDVWSSILLAFSTVPRDQQDNDTLNDAVEAMRSTTKQELQHYLLTMLQPLTMLHPRSTTCPYCATKQELRATLQHRISTLNITAAAISAMAQPPGHARSPSGGPSRALSFRPGAAADDSISRNMSLRPAWRGSARGRGSTGRSHASEERGSLVEAVDEGVDEGEPDLDASLQRAFNEHQVLDPDMVQGSLSNTPTSITRTHPHPDPDPYTHAHPHPHPHPPLPVYALTHPHPHPHPHPRRTSVRWRRTPPVGSSLSNRGSGCGSSGR